MGHPCLVGQGGDICILTTTTAKDFKTNNRFQKYLLAGRADNEISTLENSSTMSDSFALWVFWSLLNMDSSIKKKKNFGS